MYNLLNIKEIAANKNISIKSLVVRIGISEPGFYKSLENNSMNIKTLAKIAELLKVSVSELINDRPEKDLKKSGVVESPVTLYELDRYPMKYYLVSTGLEPGLFKWNTRKLDKIWDKLRTKMELEKDQQLYSYRDTGITALENKSIPESVIRKLTDHKSDKMLRRYVRKPSQDLINSVVKQITE